MSDYFDEKTDQVSTDSLIAFGIPIQSRYGKAGELADMLLFAREVALAGLEKRVTKVFYDSKACICSVTCDPPLIAGEDADVTLLAAAKKTISQFEWDGYVYHKDGTKELDLSEI